ncbi:MAG: Rrf2 family transcriptional regulator [Candidatus Sumerlaeaceae bacterium]|nr:Rrf2 family transcriptional regulator [Candidatus Sumerlaeaceae bacterium]
MLTQTSEAAVHGLIYMAVQSDPDVAFKPRIVAEAIGASASYMAKIFHMLARAGILKSRRGVAGGVQLGRPAASITLLEIVQACQGLMISNYCDALGSETSPDVCAFHQAMFEVQDTTKRVLMQWTLAELAAKPAPTGELGGNSRCRMLTGCAADCFREAAKKAPALPSHGNPYQGKAS